MRYYLHYYFLLQGTIKCHISITLHPCTSRLIFSLKLSIKSILIPITVFFIFTEIFETIFSKTGNYLSFEMFLSFVLCFYRNLSFIFSISQKKLFECNVCFFIALYIAFFGAKKLSRNESGLSAVTLTKLVMKLRRQVKGNYF